jgi:electron transfer flavoprotein alpha subunit
VLRIAVCIKQIPLIEDANFDPVTKTIKRDGAAVISAYDLRAIALGVELKNRYGGETTVATMGPPQAREALMTALAMGMDSAVHLCDRSFAGSDTLATARVIAAWLERERFDLILMGKYSLDAETGQVGPEVAELMNIAQITGARRVEIDGRTIRAERESDEGYDEVEASMPAVITCAERVAQPIKLKPGADTDAASKPLGVLSAGNLGADPRELGFAGSPTFVSEIRFQPAPKTECLMVDVSDPARAAEIAVSEIERLGALAPREVKRRAIDPRVRGSVRGRDIWVVCDTSLDENLTRATLELMSCADETASRLGGAVVAVGFPRSIARHADTLAGFGADHVLVIDSPVLESYSPEAAAQAIAELVREREPWGILMTATERGRDFGPRLAARLGAGLTGDAVAIELDEKDQMIALKPAFGGNVIAPILSKTYPQMATIRPGVLELGQPAVGKRCEVEFVVPMIANPKSRLIRSHSTLDKSIAPLEGAPLVVGLGMGIGGPEGVASATEFARAIGAGMCATRRVTDQGWVPRQLQVGLTGKSIAPRLYFSIGQRGVANHTCGIKRAECVVAINPDAEAQIFERANIGLAIDWRLILPALRHALERRLR